MELRCYRSPERRDYFHELMKIRHQQKALPANGKLQPSGCGESLKPT